MENDGKILRFRIEFVTSEEDSDEVTGVIDNQKKVVELYEFEGEDMKYKGFIPFSSIKKLEIIDEESEEEI